MNKARMRLGFLIASLLLMLSGQIPLLIVFSAIGWEPITIIIGESLLAIASVMIAGLMLAQEDYDGR